MNNLGKELAELLDSTQKKSVGQKELELLQRLRFNQARLKRELADAEAAAKGLESSIMGRLKAGARVYGRLSATIDKVPGPSHPHYKEELLQHMQEAHGIAPELTEREVQNRWPGEERERVVVAPKQGPREVK